MVYTSFAPLLAFGVALLVSEVTAAPIVQSSLQSTLNVNGKADIVVTFKAGVADPVNSIRNKKFPNRGQRLTELVSQLETHARGCQQSVSDKLTKDAKKKDGHTYSESFWISNQQFIQGASPALVKALSLDPTVAEIRQEIILPPPQIKLVVTNTTAKVTPTATNEWGLTTVSAPGVWATGFTGQNVVVGSIDTGVYTSHNDL